MHYHRLRKHGDVQPDVPKRTREGIHNWAPNAKPEERLFQSVFGEPYRGGERMARLLRAVDTLPEDKKRIICRRYGLPDTRPVTIRNLAIEWGVVYETANRWVNVVLAELRRTAGE